MKTNLGNRDIIRQLQIKSGDLISNKSNMYAGNHFVNYVGDVLPCIHSSTEGLGIHRN